MQWDIYVERRSAKRLNVEITRRHLREIGAAACRNKALGFTCKVGKLDEPEEVIDAATGETSLRYLVRIRLEKLTVRSEESARTALDHALAQVKRCAESKGWSLLPLQAVGEGEETTSPSLVLAEPVGSPLDAPPSERRPPFELPELNQTVYDRFFSGIYERDPHIRIIHDAVSNYMTTKGKLRSHVLLYGLPAGCKTTIFEAFKRWYEAGENGEVERVALVDATTMTKAGVESWLLARARANNLPEVLCLEEIEKFNKDNLLSLLAIMDGRGTISRLNARLGRVEAKAEILIWATCNDTEALRQFRNEAIWSRFKVRLHCPRPTRELMHRILRREIEGMPGGNPAWADAIIQFAYEQMVRYNLPPIEDPRTIIGFLDGRDRLLNGSYQKDRILVMRDELAETRRLSAGQGQRRTTTRIEEPEDDE